MGQRFGFGTFPEDISRHKIVLAIDLDEDALKSLNGEKPLS